MSDLKPGSCIVNDEDAEDLPKGKTLLDLLKDKGFPVTEGKPDDRYHFKLLKEINGCQSTYSWWPKENG